MNKQEIQRQKIERLVKVALAGAVCFFVAPVIFVTIKGLVGLVSAFVIGSVVVNLAPWFGAKVANWRLKALKHEAALNPIETLETEYQTRLQQVATFEQRIKTFYGEIGLFENKVDGFVDTYGEKEAAKFVDQLEKMRRLYADRLAKLKRAQAELVTFEQEIQKARSIWEMAKAAAALSASAMIGTDEFVRKIQVDTALDSVQRNLGMAFADLETSLVDEPRQLADAQPVIEIPQTSSKVTA